MTVHILLGSVLASSSSERQNSKRCWMWPSCPMTYAQYSRIAVPLGGRLLRRLQSGRRKPLVHARGGFGLPGFAYQFIALYPRWERFGLLFETLSFLRQHSYKLRAFSKLSEPQAFRRCFLMVWTRIPTSMIPLMQRLTSRSDASTRCLISANAAQNEPSPTLAVKRITFS